MGTINRKFLGNVVKPAKSESSVADKETKRSCMTKKYDLWILGRHKLFCGNSTDIESYEWLMGGLKADLVVTDIFYKMSNDVVNQYLYESFYYIGNYTKDDVGMYVFYSNTDWEFCKMKPELLVNLILASQPAGIVLDPFGGNGTTMIACETMGHTCRMIEQEERLCDAIVERFIEKMESSENVVLIRDGVTLKYAEVGMK